MALITEATLYGDMAVGDVFPDGTEIAKITRTMGVPTMMSPSEELVAISVAKVGPCNGGRRALTTYGPQYASQTYGDAVGHAEFMRDNLAKCSDG